jgi:hypothetical protein
MAGPNTTRIIAVLSLLNEDKIESLASFIRRGMQSWGPARVESANTPDQ